MSGNKFVLPIGIDGETLITPLNASIDTLEKLQNSSKDTGKALNDAFTQGATAIDKVDDKLKPITKDLNAIKVLGKQVGKEMAEAFSSSNLDPEKLNAAVESFKQKLTSIQKVEINVDADPAKLAVFEQQMEQATDGMELLKIATAATQEVLKNLDPNSPEYQQATENINFLEAAMTEFGEQVDTTVTKQKSLKAQLREMKADLAAMELAGKSGSQGYKDLLKAAGALEDQIGDTNAQIKAMASDTQTFDALISGAQGLTGAFAATQGVVGLLGTENEDLEKALLKVNSAMAILQGLQAVAETLNKDSALSVLLLSKAKKADIIATEGQAAATGVQTVAMNGANLASKALKIGLASIGIGLIIALVAYLVANWDKLKASMEKLLPATKDTGKAWDELKAIFLGIGTALVEYVIAPFKVLFALITDGLDAAVDQAKQSLNVVDNYNKGYAQQTVANAKNHALELKKIRLEQWESNLKIQEAEGIDTYKSREKLYKNQIAVAKLEGAKTKEIEQELAEFQARKRGENRKAANDAAKKLADDRKKAADDAAKKREEDAKKAAEFAKQQNELVAKYTREITKLKIDSLDEGLEKERQKIKDAAKNQIDDLNKEEAKRADAVAKRKELIIKIEEDAIAKIKELEQKAAQEKLQTQLEGQEMLLKLQGESLNASLEISRINHEKTLLDIAEKYKNESELKTQLLNAENEAFKKEQDRINLEDKQRTIALQEEKAILVILLMKKNGKQTVNQEKQTQLAVLQVQLEAAEKSLKALTDSGKTANDIEVLRARNLVKDIKNAIQEEASKGYQFDLGEFLGIGKGGKVDAAKLKTAVNESMKVLGDFTSFMIDQYDQQIDKKKEQIDQTQSEIEDLEGRLEKEKELKEQGFANNVDLIQAELDAKKDQQAQQIAQEQELLDKKKQMQKVQLALDTVSQLSGLITASVNIFEGFSSIPIVGIPLAISMIGLMFGTFAASKIKAAQAINQQSVTSYADGGEIDGNPHSRGGVKYYSKDGKTVKELEGGEYVTNKFSYKKYQKLVAALNKDDFSGLSIDEIAAMGIFKSLGISYIPETMVDAIDDTRQIKSYAASGVNYSSTNGSSNEDLKSINKNVAYLANSKKEEIPVEDSAFYYRKRGTRTTLTRKTK